MSAAGVKDSRRGWKVALVLNHLLCRESVYAAWYVNAWAASEKLLCLCCGEACLKRPIYLGLVACYGIVHLGKGMEWRERERAREKDD